jgi:hypothetical protein
VLMRAIAVRLVYTGNLVFRNMLLIWRLLSEMYSMWFTRMLSASRKLQKHLV